ncbi:MAG: MFS transporter [Propionibacteriales bacterium]|nr:MFS transporter [Propionibacteriales bacterium]
MTTTPPLSIDRTQRRTIATLAGSQVLGGVGVTAGVAVGTLLAADLSGSETWAGLGGTSQTVGGAVFAMVIARVMAARGRRPGLALGYVIAIIGGLLVITAAVIGSFGLFLCGSLLFGGATAANSQARFAAADLSEEHHRGRHLSIVVWATTIGAVAGPNLTGLGDDAAQVLGIPVLAGPYAFSLIGLVLATGVLWLWLRPDPLLTARAMAVATPETVARPGDGQPGDGQPNDGQPGEADTAAARAASGTPVGGLRSILAHRPALLGLLAMALGHAVMVSVMVMTPLHMRHGAASLEVIGIVISLHIVGMYAFSPITGWAVDRFGGRVIVATGAALLLTAAILAGSSQTGPSIRLTAGLIVLGLGWSCTLIAGSTLLTSALSLNERTGAQGMADVAMGLAGGGGGFLAGVIVQQWGFATLAVLAGGLGVLLGVLVFLLRRDP